MVNKYTVLLLMPDYASDGQEDYLAYVEGEGMTPRMASQEARSHAADAYAREPGEIEDDIRVLAIFEGHLSDVGGGL